MMVLVTLLTGCGGSGSTTLTPDSTLAAVSTLAPNTTLSQVTTVTSEPSPPISCVGGDATVVEGDGEISKEEASEMSIADLLRTDPRFDHFRRWADETISTGLGLSWLEIWDMSAGRMGDDRDGVTVFAPADSAFESLDPALASALADGLDNELRYTLLGHHYVHRLYPSSDWRPGPQRTWRGSRSVELTLDPPTWGGCSILQTDIRVNNGYVHVIAGIVLPAEARQAAGG